MLACAALVLSFVCAGCDKKESTPKKNIAKAEDQPVIDPKLRKVIAASSANAPGAATLPEDSNAPPASGIFTEQQGNAIHPQGKPIHVEMGTTGVEPRVVLQFTKPAPKSVSFYVATMTGPTTGLPSLDMTFGWTAQAAKKSEPGDTADANLIGTSVRADLNKVALSQQQPGRIPDAAAKAILDLKNSRVQFTLLPSGGAQIQSVERSQAAGSELEHPIVAVAEAIAAGALPVPAEAVGQNATWIARSRDTFGGLDLISYRMFRIKSIDENSITYTVNVRQYSVGDKVSIPVVRDNATLVQFESSSEGEFVIDKGHSFAARGSLNYTLMIGLKTPESDDQGMRPMMLQSTIRLPATES